MIGWFMSLSKGQRGGIVYGLVLAAWLFGLELPGHFGWLPIPTLSGDVRDAIKWWHPIGVMIAFFFFVLWGHFDRGWSAAYLIITATLILAALLTHIIAGQAST